MIKNPQSLLDQRDPVSLAGGNPLLARLTASADAQNSLVPHLKVVSLDRNQVLYEHSDKIETLYFPIDSVVSTLVIMEDGVTIETSMIGPEGLVGISAILGSGRARQWHWVLIDGIAIQLEAKVLDRLLIRNEEALKSFLRFYRLLITQASQRCVCNNRACTPPAEAPMTMVSRVAMIPPWLKESRPTQQRRKS